MENTFYLLRHSSVVEALEKRSSELELSKEGLKQAKSLVPVLNDLEVDFVFTSPYKRALETLEPYLEKSSLKAKVELRLAGRNLGDLKEKETKKFFKKSWKDFSYAEENTESALDCQERMTKFLQELDSVHDKKKFLLVTHSNLICFYLHRFDSSIDYNWYKKMKTPALFKVIKDDQSFEEIDLSPHL